MKQILLSSRKGAKTYTVVSDEDYDFATQWTWCMADGYAVRYSVSDEKRKKKIYLHRLILARKIGRVPLLTDHANCNKLDNHRANLREANYRQNSANRGKQSNNKLGFKGVVRNHNLFSAFICSRYLGTFPTVEAAHAMYALAASEHFGSFARTS